MLTRLVFIAAAAVPRIMRSSPLGQTRELERKGVRIAAHAFVVIPVSETATVRALSLPVSFSSMADGRVDAAALEVEWSVHLVLEFGEHVVARHRLARRP